MISYKVFIRLIRRFGKGIPLAQSEGVKYKYRLPRFARNDSDSSTFPLGAQVKRVVLLIIRAETDAPTLFMLIHFDSDMRELFKLG